MIDISSRAIDKPMPDDRNARTSAPLQILPWLAIEAHGTPAAGARHLLDVIFDSPVFLRFLFPRSLPLGQGAVC
jgi:hypothetical protein